MRSGKNRLFLINKRLLKILSAALAGVIIIIVIFLIVSSSRQSAEKKAAIAGIAETGAVKVGLRGDIPPLCSYNDESGTYEGLEKDVAEEVIKRLFDGDIIVEYISVNSETKDSMLLTDDLDIALGASVHGSTSGIYYSSSFYSDGTAFLVREGEITSLQGLSGGTLAVVQGTPPAAKSTKDKEKRVLDEYLGEQGVDASVKVYASFPEAMEALRAGYVNGVCANEIFLRVFGKSGMLILPERFMPTGFCIEARKTLGSFCDSVDDTLKEMRKDGTMESLIQKWGLIDYAGLEE